MEFFGEGLEGVELGLRFGAGGVGQERDEKFAGFDVLALGEGIDGEGGAEIVGGAEDDFRFDLEGLLDGGLNFPGELRCRLLFRAEDDVATLDVGLRVFELERGVEGAECVHFNAVVGADIDAAEHGDEYGHSVRLGAMQSDLAVESVVVADFERTRHGVSGDAELPDIFFDGIAAAGEFGRGVGAGNGARIFGGAADEFVGVDGELGGVFLIGRDFVEDVLVVAGRAGDGAFGIALPGAERRGIVGGCSGCTKDGHQKNGQKGSH